MATAEPQPYVLEGTEVQSIPSKILQRDYEIFVSLPDGYAKSDKRYPVLFVTDANYAFPLVRSIARRVGDRGRRLQDFILIGLSYAKGDTPTFSRNRDYTPTDINLKKTRRRDQAEGVYGQAEPYRQFIEKEVFPFVEKHYRADMARKIYAGHSYGGLLGVHILLTAPAMFDSYILGSPSFWFDQRITFDDEKRYAASHKDLPARVYMFIGAFEAVQPGSKDPRYNHEDDMVKDAKDFERVLKSRRYPGLTIKGEVIRDEDHLTVFPALITRGLLWALGPG